MAFLNEHGCGVFVPSFRKGSVFRLALFYAAAQSFQIARVSDI